MEGDGRGPAKWGGHPGCSFLILISRRPDRAQTCPAAPWYETEWQPVPHPCIPPGCSPQCPQPQRGCAQIPACLKSRGSSGEGGPERRAGCGMQLAWLTVLFDILAPDAFIPGPCGSWGQASAGDWGPIPRLHLGQHGLG